MLRLFLFFPFLLLSQELFTLPQEGQYALYTLKEELIKADKKIKLFSPSLNDYTLINALKKLSKKGVSITLVSSNTNKQTNALSALSLLENVTLYTLKEHELRKLKGSIICIDNVTLYLSSHNLDHSSIQQDYGFASLHKKPCDDFFQKLLQLGTKIR